MKSKERVAKQGVARDGKVGERIYCVYGGGGGGKDLSEKRKEKKRGYISQSSCYQDSFKTPKTKREILLFSLSLPPYLSFFICFF